MPEGRNTQYGAKLIGVVLTMHGNSTAAEQSRAMAKLPQKPPKPGQQGPVALPVLRGPHSPTSLAACHMGTFICVCTMVECIGAGSCVA